MDDLKGFCNNYESLVKLAMLIERFSTDIGMELGLGKCKVVNLVRGKYVKLGGVLLESGGLIAELEEDEIYKYLGVEELDGIKHEKMKENIWQAAKKKLRKILESELNSRNIIQAVNECCLPIVSYSFGIINWNESDLKGMDVSIRKMLNMYKCLQLKSDIDRLYVPRGSGGRGLISIWDSFRATSSRIAHVIKNSENELLKLCGSVDVKSVFSNIARAEKYEQELLPEWPADLENKSVLRQAKVKASYMRELMARRRFDTWKGKPQHGAFLRLLEESEADVKASLGWLKRCHLDPYTEGFICAAQELGLFTRYHEMHILKTRNDDRCRVCRSEQETIFHILAGCDVLAKSQYFDRHNAVCKYVHFMALKCYSLEQGNNWHSHRPKEVIRTNNVEILYDQILSTDRPIGANRPDIVIKDKLARKAYVIDISCPCDTNVFKKENEKIAKYQGLRAELQKMWNMDCIVIPVVVGGLGAVTRQAAVYLSQIPGTPDLMLCQKIALLGSKKILHNVLGRK